MQSPYNSPGQPPISDPTGSGPSYVKSVPGITPGDWASAPRIIKGWAWQLAILGAVLLPFLIFAIGNNSGFSNLFVVIYGVSWFIDLFMVYSIRQGLPVAWYVQIVVSILGLSNCPIGTLLHGYLLSQWFKPEVKAWFKIS